MSKNHLIAYGKLCSLMAIIMGGLLLASCADDGYDDGERFESGVRNSQLDSPTEVNVTASADGKSQTFAWPVVYGASGYQVALYDASNMDEALVDSLVEGCTVTMKREEDINYVLSIRTIGNSELGNTDASESLLYRFTTFTPTFATIPAGSDLNEWFAENPIPSDSLGKNLNFDLEGGAEYTLSAALDFDAFAVTLRSTSKTNHAKITYTTAESTINFGAGLNVKYLDFDCSGMGDNNMGVFAFSKNPTGPIGTDIDAATYKWTGLLILDPVTIVNCNFYNVKGYFMWDNQVKACAMTVLVDNCVVHLAPEKSLAGGVFWSNKGGQFNNLTVSNSTFYELPDCPGDYKYFYQAGMVSGEEIYAVKEAASNSTTYENSTFYHVTWNNGQWGNYNRMGGRDCSWWTMTDCIFYDCSPTGVARRFLHGKKNQKHVVCANNTYMKKDGTFDNNEYDTSGTMIEEDPVFANPAAADFTISGPTQVARKTGDPRWLP